MVDISYITFLRPLSGIHYNLQASGVVQVPFRIPESYASQTHYDIACSHPSLLYYVPQSRSPSGSFHLGWEILDFRPVELCGHPNGTEKRNGSTWLPFFHLPCQGGKCDHWHWWLHVPKAADGLEVWFHRDVFCCVGSRWLQVAAARAIPLGLGTVDSARYRRDRAKSFFFFFGDKGLSSKRVSWVSPHFSGNVFLVVFS